MYVKYDFYKSLYGESLKEEAFNNLAWEACKKADYYTTGVDGVKKLKHFFPVDDDDAESVKRGICKLINIMNQINLEEETQRNARSYVTKEDGTLHGKVVSSVSSGNESITYSVGNASAQIASAVSDLAIRERLYIDTISEYLSGITDSNGVNLMYMGRYPKGVI